MYHVVFIPKCRSKILYGNLRQHLGEVFHKLADQCALLVLSYYPFLLTGGAACAQDDRIMEFGIGRDVFASGESRLGENLREIGGFGRKRGEDGIAPA
jgi:hypothetical protein